MAIGTATPGDDVLISSVAGEVIDGLEGNDVLTAVHDNVTLIGGPGDLFDQLISQLGTSNTIMDGGAGIDLLTGGGANDTASYASATAGVGVTVDLFVEEIDGAPLGTGVAFEDGHGTRDQLIDIENVTGSNFNDSLTGNVNANVLQGGMGNDTLAGDGGADSFEYSFNLEHVPGDGDVPQSFGEWLSTEHALNIATLKQNEFVQNYEEWLGYVADELRENHGFDSIPENAKVSFKQNDPNGTPQIEGLTQTQLGEIFGDATAISVKTGKTSQARYYSDIDTNSDVWAGSEEDIVTSGDGSDSIVDFGDGADKIRFDFTAATDWDADFADNDAKLVFLEGFFDIAPVDLFGADGANDSTRIQFADEVQAPVNDPTDDTWSVTLETTLLTDAQVFAALDIYVNDVLIG
jgi:hypothetical protein